MNALDGPALRARLRPCSAQRLDELRVAARVDSSNSVLLREAATLPRRVALLVDAQDAGRGRRGRSWQSPPGANLYLSLFARIDRPLREVAGLAIATGIGCVQALQRGGVPRARLKWPNDLLVDGRKLGGLLLESAGERDGRAAVVIGLGLNLAMPPDAAASIDQPWIDLAELGVDSDRAGWAARMIDALLDTVERFERDGLGPFLADWPHCDALAGRELEVRAGDRLIHGRALGIADDGALRLCTEGAELRVHSAEVSLRAR